MKKTLFSRAFIQIPIIIALGLAVVVGGVIFREVTKDKSPSPTTDDMLKVGVVSTTTLATSSSPLVDSGTIKERKITQPNPKKVATSTVSAPMKKSSIFDRLMSDLGEKTSVESTFQENFRSSSELGTEFITNSSDSGNFENSMNLFIPGGLTSDSVLRLEGGDYPCDFIVMASDPTREDFIGDDTSSGGWRIEQKDATFPGFNVKGWKITGWIGGVNCHGTVSNTRIFKDGVYRIMLLKNGQVVAKSSPLNISWREKTADNAKMQISIDYPSAMINSKVNLHLEATTNGSTPKDVQYSIDWGDGTPPSTFPESGIVHTYIKVDFSHSYASPGSHTIWANLSFSTSGHGLQTFKENVVVDVRSYEPSCTDSDGGSNPQVLGTTRSTDYRNYVSQSEDWCNPDTIGYVNEGVCVDNTFVVNKIFCPAGCANGICNPE